jgi:hypothetical protein
MCCVEARNWLLGIGALLGLAWSARAQNEPPCVPGSYPFVYAGAGTLAPKTGAPFSAKVKWTFDQRLSDGNVIHAVEWTRQARDSAGRARTERAQGCYRGEDGQPHPRMDVTVIDPTTETVMFWTVGLPGQMEVHVSHRKARVAAPLASSADQAAVLDQQKTAAAKQEAQEQGRRILLGTTTIGGVSADGWRNVLTITAGSEGNLRTFETMREFWTSKELGITVKSIFDDPRKGRCAFELEDVSLSEPNLASFAPPAGYKIVDDTPVQ